MAAVFDLDLETEEGSEGEGEGEPEFSPAVSGPPGRGWLPELMPSPRRWDRLGSPHHGGPRSFSDRGPCSVPSPPSPRPAFQNLPPTRLFHFCSRPLLPSPAHHPPAPIPVPFLSWAQQPSLCGGDPAPPWPLTPRFPAGRVSPRRLEGGWPGVSDGRAGGGGSGKGNLGRREPCPHRPPVSAGLWGTTRRWS